MDARGVPFASYDATNAGNLLAVGREGYAIEGGQIAVSVPIVASLNGTSEGGWLRYARLCEDAGADALELNVYAVEVDPERSSADVEARTVALVREVRRSVSIPLAVKVGPFYSAFAHMAVELAEAGADGLVLFNRSTSRLSTSRPRSCCRFRRSSACRCAGSRSSATPSR